MRDFHGTGLLRLADLRADIGEADLSANARMLDLVVDHWCWSAAMADWRARQPRDNRRELLPAWIEEGKQVFSILDELKSRARAFGLQERRTGQP